MFAGEVDHLPHQATSFSPILGLSLYNGTPEVPGLRNFDPGTRIKDLAYTYSAPRERTDLGVTVLDEWQRLLEATTISRTIAREALKVIDEAFDYFAYGQKMGELITLADLGGITKEDVGAAFGEDKNKAGFIFLLFSRPDVNPDK